VARILYNWDEAHSIILSRLRGLNAVEIEGESLRELAKRIAPAVCARRGIGQVEPD
jgi:hypothetical protein